MSPIKRTLFLCTQFLSSLLSAKKRVQHKRRLFITIKSKRWLLFYADEWNRVTKKIPWDDNLLEFTSSEIWDNLTVWLKNSAQNKKLTLFYI